MVRVNETFAEPYVLYNLLNGQNEIIGNAGFCRNAASSVIISIKSTTEYLKALKRFVAEDKQPIVRFEAPPADDDTTSFESVIYDWPEQGLSINYPVDASDDAKGELILGDGKPCR